MEVARFLAGQHPVLVHFPIAFLVLGVLADGLFLWRREQRLAWAGLWLILLGTAGALLAFVCGILAEVFAARSGIPQEPIEAHEWMATVTTWLFMIIASIRLFLGHSPDPRGVRPLVAAGAMGCLLLAVTAHRGGELVYRYGANVAGAQSLRMPSDEDLAALAQHQEEITLYYSNQMHWIFGYLVLLLGLMILFERLRLGPLARLRAAMPLVFQGGGAYLFVYSDWDSWPLSDLRPILDPEVLQHKVIAIVMFLIGVAALAQRRRQANSEATAAWSWQNKLIAVMALAGGSVLFTHLHTNAPYTNVAIGVYLHHTVLGTVALAIAASVLLQEAYPHSKRIALLFPALLIVEAGLLIRYNEDLPWFLGYESISNNAPNGGLLAHIPGGRAELLFDAKEGDLSVSFIDRRSNRPRPVAARELRGIIEARQQKHPITLAAVSTVEGRAHRFVARAEWLRHVPMFSLSLEVPNQEGGEARAEFEPFVTAPLLPPLVGAQQAYRCPMCSDVISSRDGRCTMCGMDLVAIPKEKLHEAMTPKWLPLHDDKYRMVLDSSPASPRAGQTCRLRFRLHRGTDIVKEVRMVHERLLHLLIVSRDLNWFAHVHPVRRPDGSFELDQLFPHGGRYVLFADLAPAEDRIQIFRLELEVEGDTPAPTRLEETHHLTRYVGGHEVTLQITPQAPRANQEALLTFAVAQKGRPVHDLGLFLGAVGHCVMIHEDTQEFVHTHALQLTAAAPPPGGPTVSFHAYLPKRGLYKIWGQFAHQGKVLTADFVFRAH